MTERHNLAQGLNDDAEPNSDSGNSAAGDQSKDFDIVAAANDAYRSRYSEAVREFAALCSLERAVKILQAYAKPDLEVYGLTYAGWQVLMVLSYAKSKEMQTVKLAARIGSHPTTLTKTVDNLVRKGFVERKPKSGDRRVVIVKLTAEGDAAQEKINESRIQAKFGITNVSESELDDLIGILGKIRLGLGDLWQTERSS